MSKRKKIEKATNKIMQDYIPGNIPRGMMKNWISQKLSTLSNNEINFLNDQNEKK